MISRNPISYSAKPLQPERHRQSQQIAATNSISQAKTLLQSVLQQQINLKGNKELLTQVPRQMNNTVQNKSSKYPLLQPSYIGPTSNGNLSSIAPANISYQNVGQRQPYTKNYEHLDYDTEDDDLKLKEQFFESLGLPGDLNNLNKGNSDYFTVGAQTTPSNFMPTNIEIGNSFNPHATFNPPLNRSDLNSEQSKQPMQLRETRKELLTLTIEIGDGQNETILIYEGDDPNRLAQAFAIKHQIEPQLTSLLADQIRENINQVASEQDESYMASEHQHFSANPGPTQTSPNNMAMPYTQQYRNWSNTLEKQLKTENGRYLDRPQINKSSKAMVEVKRQAQDDQNLFRKPVHERLYQVALQKQKVSLRSNSRDEKDKFEIAARKPPMPNQANYGERLYQKGIRQKEEREIQLREARSEIQRQEVEEVTFHPKINNRMNSFERSQRTEDILIRYGEKKEEKLAIQRRQKSEQELDGIDFRPRILKKSEDIVRNREMQLEQNSVKSNRSNQSGTRSQSQKRSNSKFESLYQDAKRRNERQLNIYSACLESECTFQPDLELSKPRFSNSDGYKPGGRADRSELFERLSQGLSSSRERSQLMLANSQTLSQDLYDPETGQQLFKPKIGRGPRTQKRPPIKSSQTTGKMLFEASKEGQIKRHSKQVEAQIETIKKSNTVFTNKQTNQIQAKKKAHAFLQIFQWLDSDGDGKISAQHIDITQLDTNLLEVMSPLFIEMEELGQPLDVEEFTDAISRLFDCVSLPEKEIILLKPDKREKSLTNKRKHLNPDVRFQPTICENSRQLAAEIHQGVEVSQRLYKVKKPPTKQEEDQNFASIPSVNNFNQKPSPSAARSPKKPQTQSHLRNFQQNSDLDLNNLAHMIASEMLQKHMSGQATLPNNFDQNLMSQGQHITSTQNSSQAFSNRSFNSNSRPHNIQRLLQ